MQCRCGTEIKNAPEWLSDRPWLCAACSTPPPADNEAPEVKPNFFNNRRQPEAEPAGEPDTDVQNVFAMIRESRKKSIRRSKDAEGVVMEEKDANTNRVA